MDSNDWRHPPVNGAAAGDCPSQLQPDSGQRILNQMLQQHNVIDPQKMFQSQKIPTKAPTSLDSDAQTGNSDWQEEVYQKIKVMNDLYFAEVDDIYQRLCSKLQQLEALSQQANPEGVEKLKFFKLMLERILQYLQIPQNGVQTFHKDRLPTLEREILGVISAHRTRQPDQSLQQGEIPPPNLQSLQQNQQSHSQIHQTQWHGSGVNSQLESVNVQGSSVPTMQPGEMSVSHGSVFSVSGNNSSQLNMMNSLQPCSNFDSGQGNAPSSVQQVAMRSIQQSPAIALQQASVNVLTPLLKKNLVDPSNCEELVALKFELSITNSNILQGQHLKQQPEQKLKQQCQHGHIQQLIVIDPQKMIQSQQNPTEAPSTSLYYSETGNSDWQDEVYQKIRVMKDLYFAEVDDIYQKMCAKLQLHEALSQQAKPEGVEKLKLFKQMLERILQYLQIHRNSIQPFHKDRLPTLEKQILGVVSSHRPRKPGPILQQKQIPPPHLQSLQQNQQSHSQIPQTQSHESGVNSRLQPGEMSGLHGSVSSLSGMTTYQPHMMNSFTEASSAFLDYAETGNSDWQDEVYQKIKVMKDLHFAEVDGIYQKMCAKLQQHEALSQQAKPEGVEKLKFFKQLLERILQYLQIHRNSIQPFHKDRLPTLEKQILGVLSSHRPRKLGPPLQQGQIPPPHLQSLQQKQQSHSQIPQTQSHESVANSQSQSVKVQGSSVPTMQPGEMSGLHGSVSSLSGMTTYQPQMNSFTEAPSASLDSSAHTANFDWQEEVYQKIKALNDLYFAEVHSIYLKMCAKLQQHESPSQQAKPEVVEKLKFFKKMIERIMAYLQLPKSSIQPFHTDRVSILEKQILGVLSQRRQKDSSTITVSAGKT